MSDSAPIESDQMRSLLGVISNAVRGLGPHLAPHAPRWG